MQNCSEPIRMVGILKAKEYLQQIVYLDCKIEEKRERVNELKEKAINTTSCMGTERVQSSGSKNMVESAVCSYTALEA